MRHWGYRNVSLTSAGTDQGIDVRATGAVAQVKFEAKQVGRPQLQNLVGARGRNSHLKLLFFTGAGYSRHAIEYASEMDIALFTYALDGQMIAQSPAAKMITSSTRSGGGSDTAKSSVRGDLRRLGEVAITLTGLVLVQRNFDGVFEPESRAPGFGAAFSAWALLIIGIVIAVVGWSRLRATMRGRESSRGDGG
jgi:hypothetical protein